MNEIMRNGRGLADDHPMGASPMSSGFTWTTRVFFDELDAMGMLHNARYLALIERASSAFFEANGWRWERDPTRNPDQYYVVSEQTVHYREPITGPSDVVVVMWVTRLGTTSATYAFQIQSPDGSRVYALAERVHVKLHPGTHLPTEWTPRLRDHLMKLLRPADPANPTGPARGTSGVRSLEGSTP